MFRIGHLGDLNELMLMGAIAGTEMATLDADIKVTSGSGVAAASGYWRKHRQQCTETGGRVVAIPNAAVG